MLLGARVYRTEIEDLIENVFDFTTSKGANQNIDAAEIDGAEIFAEWFVNERFSLALDYAWTDAVNADTGARLLRRPTHIWTARAQWRPVERAALRLSWSAVADRRDVLYNDAGFFVTNNGRLDGYERVDVSGLYDLTDRVQAFASVRNVFDETYEEPAAFAAAPRATMIGLRLRR